MNKFLIASIVAGITIVMITSAIELVYAPIEIKELVVRVSGFASCETTSADDCGPVKMKSKTLLQIQNVDENNNASGIGKTEINAKFTGEKDFDNQIQFRSNDLTFTYDPLGRQISVYGLLNTSNDIVWQYDFFVRNIVIENTDNQRIKADCSSRIISSNGIVIEQTSVRCGIIFVPLGDK